MVMVEINGYETNVVDVGEGPRTLVTHGGFIVDADLWMPQVETLSKRGWRVVAYDHRGSGASQAPIETITVDAMVDDLFAVLEHCGIENCVLAGESMGSIVVERAAVREPERFSHLVIVAGAGRFPKTPVYWGMELLLRHAYRVATEVFVWSASPERGTSKSLRKLVRAMFRRSGPEAALKVFDEFVGVDQRTLVREIKIPTLLIHGTMDLIVPIYFRRELRKLIPNSTSVTLPWVGHGPTLTKPDAVSDAIEAFVTTS